MLRRQEILLARLSLDDVLRLGEIFDYGPTADWNTCDWVRVRFSGSLVARDLPEGAAELPTEGHQGDGGRNACGCPRGSTAAAIT